MKPPAACDYWLLDTNIISDLMKNPTGLAASALTLLKQSQPDALLVTSIVVECEIKYGLEKKQSTQLKKAYSLATTCFDVLPLHAATSEHYAQLRTALERAGTPIGPNDMLIAAHAIALGATLVTDNEEEFRRIPSLKTANWLRPQTGTHS
jgi:tRNA(fMet)-specific endonuclease VapC